MQLCALFHSLERRTWKDSEWLRSNHVGWNASAIRVFCILYRPRIKKGPKVATNDVTRADVSCRQMS